MHKDPLIELWQLKMGLIGMIEYLNGGPDHLDKLTGKTVARALGELMQEVVSLSDKTPREEIEVFAREILAGTDEMKEQMAAKWYDELQPNMERANQRALNLGHDLAEFSCLSVDGQEWGSICIKCLEWVIVTPKRTRGALLRKCRGWLVSWK
ncbi:MAG: hypothetical protein BMS9Abin02_0783 [Anaerolineae bacterium]|nr:MAG: hypothetical protein BMS9Abin02_0783 [Anaerolineae bacterium]